MVDPIYRMLGLAQKAGRILSGNEQVYEGLKKRKGTLLIITEDASPRTKDEYTAAADNYGIPHLFFGNKEELGNALGKGIRTACLLTDEGFAKAIQKKVDSRN